MTVARSDLVLFDAAGTLIQPLEPVENTYREYFARYGWKTDPDNIRRGFHQAFTTIGDPDFRRHPDGDTAEREWWREVVRRTAETAGIRAGKTELDDCFAAIFEHYSSGDAWVPFPEVTEVLARLEKRACKRVVVSNFDRRLHRVMAEMGLAECFDLILTSSDVSARKPSPVLLFQAMSRYPGLGVCLVGDSARADGEAAGAAGVPVFLLDRPTTTLLDFMDWLDRHDR